MNVALLFGVFIVTLALGVPIAISLGLASLAYVVAADLPLVILPQKMYAGIDIYVLLCVPGFILAGNLMNMGGITGRIVDFSNALVGGIRGGLGLSNIAGSMLFAGISGTAVADAASIGGVMIPGMKREGYPADFSAAVTTASSTIGPIIPPSVPMVIVSSLTGIFVGKMFMAGAIPGILLGVGLMITCYFISRRRNYPLQPWQGFKRLFSSFLSTFGALAMTGLIVGGLLSGFASPIEISLVASFYAFIVGVFAYRAMSISQVLSAIINSAISAAGILILAGFANVFGWILILEHIPDRIASAVLAITENRYLIILLINILLLFVGMFMQTITALIILFPSLLAIATKVGIDPIHLATFAVLNLMIGLTTPPVGICLSVSSNIAGVPLMRVARAIFPFLLSNLVVLLLVSYVPSLATWLPRIIFGD